MNYEQAREIGPGGPAPGKWNWTNSNDSITKNPYTIAPCAWPDYDPGPWDSATMEYVGGWHPTGRERCDHDLQEQAERHHYEHTVKSIVWHPIDALTARTLYRCDVKGCLNWSTTAAWVAGWARAHLCDEHATPEGYELAVPFVAGLREAHS